MRFLTAFSTDNLLIEPYAFAMSPCIMILDSVCVVCQEFSDCTDHRFRSVRDPETHLLFLHQCNDVVSVLVDSVRFDQFQRCFQECYRS